MRSIKIWTRCAAFCVLFASALQLAAQEPTADDFFALQQRLAEQDARIRQLESRRLPPVGEPAGIFSAAHDNSLEARIAELEESMASRNAAAAAEIKPTQKWTGRIHLDHWGFPGNDDGANFFENGDPALDIQDRILFRRIRLGIEGNIGDTMRYKSEFDIATPEDAVIKDVYIGWTELPFLQTVLLGNQKRPYGLDHLNSSRYNVFLERPFTVEAFNQDARRLGVCSYGVSEDEAYNWRFGAYLGTDIQRTGAYLVTDDPGVHHYQAEITGRFANTIWYDETSDGRGYAHWAVSGALASPDGTAGDDNTAHFRTRPEARTSGRWIDTGPIANAEAYSLLGLEGVVNVGAVQLVGEYQFAWVDRFAASDLEFNGGYMYLSYFLTGEHVPWERFSGTIGRVKPFENFFLVDRCCGGYGRGWGAWQIAARYSYGDFTDDDVFGGVGTAFTFGLNWWWTPYSRLQVNYIIGDIDARDPVLAFNAANYQIIGSRFMVDF